MLLGGDEFGRTQGGNNNAWCQDNEISWFDWEPARGATRELLEFTKQADRAAPRAPGVPPPPVPARAPTTEGSGLPDVWWFRPDGAPHDQERLGRRRRAARLGMFLNGEEIASPGRARPADRSTSRSCCCSTPTTRTSTFTLPNRRFGDALDARAAHRPTRTPSRTRSRSTRRGAGGSSARSLVLLRRAAMTELPRHLPAAARTATSASPPRASSCRTCATSASRTSTCRRRSRRAPGSTHGYDVVDPTSISEELGGEAEFRALVARRARGGAGRDPRHRPEPHGDRRRQPLLGRRSAAAKFFDIDAETGRHRRFFDIDHLAGVRQEDPEVFDETHELALRAGARRARRRAADRPPGRARRPGRATCERLRDGGVEHVWVEKILDPGERAARLAGRGHGRLRVPQRRRGAVRRPGRRGAADRAVGRGLRRRRGRSASSPPRPSSSRRARRSRPEVERLRARGAARGRRARARARLAAGLPHLRRAVVGRVARRGPRGARRGGAPIAGVAATRRRPGRVRHALPADDAAGDGQGRRGHRLLPLRAAARAQRRRRRPGPLRPLGRATSTPPTPSAPRASRATCSSPRRTTPSARATCGRGSARSSAMAGGVGGARARAGSTLLAGGRPAPDARRALPRSSRRWSARGRSSPSGSTAYLEKALREAKRTTNWIEPDEAHEAAVQGVRARRCIDAPRRSCADFEPFAAEVAAAGDARRARPAAAQAHRARACPTSTRATSCSRSRWSTPTTAARSTGTRGARRSPRCAAARTPTRSCC